VLEPVDHYLDVYFFYHASSSTIWWVGSDH